MADSSFEKLINGIIKDIIESINERDVIRVYENLSEDIVMTCPEIKIGSVQIEAGSKLKGRKAVVEFIKNMVIETNFKIVKYELITKNSKPKMILYFDSLKMNLELHMEIDSYGKIYKIDKKIVDFRG